MMVGDAPVFPYPAYLAHGVDLAGDVLAPLREGLQAAASVMM
jgi:hypothetical protein